MMRSSYQSDIPFQKSFCAMVGNLPPMEIPVYADVRFSTSSKLLAPYAGLTAGYDLLDRQASFSADLGLRIRLSQESSRSMWMALMGEVSVWYYRAGLKMGYSF